ncbi:alkaline phosphatase family protein [Paenibacillus macquariensis]|uniref:Phosphoesterase family protein n=1 Tax=Paenibacillus macquariensis TaxID=948756 RepID=A0ABY1JPT6_9BACL|nr:alkaline phosphatase family protein [Paenibacillus macquariensis]MEC0094027.1 alkaline phosphatase family protein [Paenibacillus macquariensis]OAB37494.1 acid phosphatase [Paenibacillus macquariensis subsp. macquariensis]SIQ54662.1 Phosphoesterase family protein [Paenibacillus macquariensis]
MKNCKQRIFSIFILVFILSSTIPFRMTSHAAVNPVSKKYKVDHIVVIVEENHSYREIYNNSNAPYMNQLMNNGANLVNHYAIEHPSQPNYLDLFSGNNQGVTNDKTPKHLFKTDNLASELIAKGLTFGGYSEGLPNIGFSGPYDLKTNYARKHNPWVNFTNIPTSVNMPFTSFPKDYSKLPTISFVIPNMDHDIHDGTVKEADLWLKENLSAYIKWAEKHNSLLILTWDEDDMSAKNKIPTVLFGPMVKKGTYNVKSNHYSLLRTIEDIYGLQQLGKSKQAKPLEIWK